MAVEMFMDNCVPKVKDKSDPRLKKAIREIREMYRIHCPNHRWIVTNTKNYDRFFKKKHLIGPIIDLTGESIVPQEVFTGTPKELPEVGNLKSHSLLDYLYKNDRFELEWKDLWLKNPIVKPKEEEEDSDSDQNLRPALGKYQRKKRNPVKKVKKSNTPALDSFQEKENTPSRKKPSRKRKVAEAGIEAEVEAAKEVEIVSNPAPEFEIIYLSSDEEAETVAKPSAGHAKTDEYPEDPENFIKEEAVSPIADDDEIKNIKTIKPTTRQKRNKCPDPGKRGSKGKTNKSRIPTPKNSKSAPNSFQAVLTKLDEIPVKKSGKRRKIDVTTHTAETSAAGRSANDISTIEKIKPKTKAGLKHYDTPAPTCSTPKPKMSGIP